MMPIMSVRLDGDRELEARFDRFPAFARRQLAARIDQITEELEGRVEVAAPVRTGRLRSEIRGRTFTDNPERVAGYVAVFAPGIAGEYAKAATLEYGSNKARKIFERAGALARLGGQRRRVLARLTKPVHIAAFEYLRGPFAQMEPEIRAQLEEAIAQAAAQGGDVA